jgi:L-threonylcarbamoyladenylate synthase
MNTKLLSQATDAAELLNNGEVVALPTETVYGLAGNATDASIVKKIFEAKERPSFDPLIVHISDSYLNTESPLATLINEKILDPAVLLWKNKMQIEELMKHFWPGPLTIILPKGIKIPNEVTSNQATVGIRCPNHPLFQKVLHSIPFPLAAPSANRFGRISPTTALHVQKELDGRIAGILDGGECIVGVESTIIKITEDAAVLLRPGKISSSEIESQIKMKVSAAPSLMQALAETSLAPGMLDEHYAPRKPLYLIPSSFKERIGVEQLQKFTHSKEESAALISMCGFHESFKSNPAQQIRILSETESEIEMAQKLFSTMRELDENPAIETIFADSPKQIREGLGASIFDRLKRASRNKPNSPL